MRKMNCFLGMFVLICLLLTSLPIYATENEINLKNSEVLDFATEFVVDTYSDFSNHSKDYKDYIDENNEKLKEFLEDRDIILKLQMELAGRDYKSLNYEIIDSKIKKLGLDLDEVLLTINHEYMTGNRKCFMQVKYKLVVKTKEDIKVAAVMSNDISASKLLGYDTNSYDELDINYQLQELNHNEGMKTFQEHRFEKPYVLEESKQDVRGLFQEINSKQNTETIKNLNSKMRPYARGFKYFSSTDKRIMKRYQDNNYNRFNPNYYNFENLSGAWDCTNYTSQVLDQVCPQYRSYSSGIQGTRYWYYKDLNNRSSSWAGVNEFRQFVVNNTTKGPTGYLVNTFGQLGVGSIIQVWNPNLGTYRHSLIVYNPGGDPYVTAHSSFYSGYASDKINGNKTAKIRIDGYYE